MLVIAVVVALAGVQASGATANQPRPTLRLTGKAPVTIVGARFRPGEIVRIVAPGPAPTQRRVRVARDGSFRVVLQTWTLDRCGTPVVIQAFGIRSGSISLKLPPQPACPPPLDRVDP